MIVRRVASANNGKSITYEIHHRAHTMEWSDNIRSYVYTYRGRSSYFVVSFSAIRVAIGVYRANMILSLTEAFGAIAAMGLNRNGGVPFPAIIECGGRCFTLTVHLEKACKGYINAERILSSEETLSHIIKEGGLVATL